MPGKTGLKPGNFIGIFGHYFGQKTILVKALRALVQMFNIFAPGIPGHTVQKTSHFIYCETFHFYRLVYGLLNYGLNTIVEDLTVLNVQNFKMVKNKPGSLANYRETAKAPDISTPDPGPCKTSIFGH